MLGLGLSIWRAVAGIGGGDSTPGGSANAFLQEDGVFGFLLEDGTSDLLMES